MLTILMNHWVTYLFLGWFAILILGNLWLRKRLQGGTTSTRTISSSNSGVQPPA